MTILSTEPDGMGFYYGNIEGDRRQINVRLAERNIDTDVWHAFVGGELVGIGFDKDEAEEVAIKWAKENPE